MNTNDSTNPQNMGTGAGSNYGTTSTGRGVGNPSTLSNEGTTYNAGTGVDSSAPSTDDAYSYTPGGMMTGTFRDRQSAEAAYNSLSSRGYDKDDVNLLMSDETRKSYFGDDTPETDLGDKAMEGAGVGSAIGGTAGAVIGAIAAIGTSVALPGLGLIIAGPIAAALAGAGAGGLTGGLVGALVGSGIPEEHAAEYEQDVKNGGIVMGVKPRNEEDARYFQEEFRRNQGERVRAY